MLSLYDVGSLIYRTLSAGGRPVGEGGHGAGGAVRADPAGGDGQGLTLVHFAAQPVPFWSHLPGSPCLIDWGEIMHPTYSHKMCLRRVEKWKSVSP